MKENKEKQESLLILYVTHVLFSIHVRKQKELKLI